MERRLLDYRSSSGSTSGAQAFGATFTGNDAGDVSTPIEAWRFARLAMWSAGRFHSNGHAAHRLVRPRWFRPEGAYFFPGDFPLWPRIHRGNGTPESRYWKPWPDHSSNYTRPHARAEPGWQPCTGQSKRSNTHPGAFRRISYRVSAVARKS